MSKKDKEFASCKLVLITGELFDITVNDFGAKKSTCCNRVFILVQLILSSKQDPLDQFPSCLGNVYKSQDIKR